MSASAQELMTAKLFFNAAFPTMQVLLDDDPKLHKKFEKFRGTVQFGAKTAANFYAATSSSAVPTSRWFRGRTLLPTSA